MIKVFVFCLLWIVAGKLATRIWALYILTEHAKSAGRDPEYFAEFEAGENCSAAVEEALNDLETEHARRVVKLWGNIYAAAIVLLWPILTPVMLANGKHADAICKFHGWG